MTDIVIFGAGQIAEVALAYIRRFGSDRVVGFTVDREYATQAEFHGLPVVPWDALETRFPPGEVKLLGPLSYQQLNGLRRDRHREGRARGYSFASFVHPSVHDMADHIGENCFILENTILQPFTRIGDGCVIWTAVHIGHHSTIGDHCFISSQVGISSGCTIGPGCLIGGQVGISNGVTIGADTYLETRCMIRRDLPPGSVVRHPDDRKEEYSSDRLKGMRFK
ncbi:acetyltransferase [Thalassovita mangrovi]|uniref:Transferase n=1 Tax=Thalassovita mangrovi TaxID=2692236 RepID=A0A6L8LNT8_9RHOB|nr:acetyltransferase [Thalassovita mangrovi]MYM56260.1 transferase [Thalassovita mangrovi]